MGILLVHGHCLPPCSRLHDCVRVRPSKADGSGEEKEMSGYSTNHPHRSRYVLCWSLGTGFDKPATSLSDVLKRTIPCRVKLEVWSQTQTATRQFTLQAGECIMLGVFEAESSLAMKSDDVFRRIIQAQYMLMQAHLV